MARDNKTQYALLGILTQFECTGYDIKKFIETSIGYFWQESFGQIYPNLKKLENDGLVISKNSQDSRESGKKIYSITKEGRKKLVEWLRSPVENTGFRNELLLKLFFGRQMDIPDILSLLKSRRIELEKTLSKYHLIEKNITGDCKTPDSPFWMLTLDYGIKTAKAELEWIESSEKLLK